MLYNFRQFLNSVPPTEELVIVDMCDNCLIRAERRRIESCTSFCRRYGFKDVLTVELDSLTKCIKVYLDC